MRYVPISRKDRISISTYLSMWLNDQYAEENLGKRMCSQLDRLSNLVLKHEKKGVLEK